MTRSRATAEDALDAALDAIQRLEREVRRAQAEQLRQIARAHELMAAIESHPARSRRDDAEFVRRATVSELATTLRVHERTASRLLADADDLASGFAATHAALASGAICVAQVRDLLDAAHTLPAAVHDAFEAAALDKAGRMTPPAFRQAARRLRERLHPERLEERREVARETRRIALEPDSDGMAWLHLHLEAERAVAIVAHLERCAARHDAGDSRTRLQREADCAAGFLLGAWPAPLVAAGGLARGARAVTGGGLARGDLGIVRPTIYVTVPALTLLGRSEEPGELDGYGPIDPQTARELAAYAPSLQRILTHPETGAFLSYGREHYRVPADLAAYLRVRDGTCRFPGCSRRAAGADIDHTVDWQFGGETQHANLAHLCRKHHRLKHNTRWRMSQESSGDIRWTSPSGREHLSRPAHFSGSTAASPTHDGAAA